MRAFVYLRRGTSPHAAAGALKPRCASVWLSDNSEEGARLSIEITDPEVTKESFEAFTRTIDLGEGRIAFIDWID